MADQIIKLKIDVTKIDKTKLFKGEKGTYLDATLFLKTDSDQYGNFGMITQDVSKEERESGVKGPILGNVKIMGAKVTQTAKSSVVDSPDDLPF